MRMLCFTCYILKSGVIVGNFYIFYSLQLYKSIYITGTKNALKHTVKHKSFGNYGYFMRESKGTLSILKLA